MSKESGAAVTHAPKRDLVLTRVFDAPRERVFNTWIDPTHVAKWWGPKDFTNPVCELAVRPGGAIRIDMAGPDGVVYPMGGVFRENAPPQRLVFTSSAFEEEAGNPQLEVLNTVTFAGEGGRTTLTLQAVIVKAAPQVEAALVGMQEGWNQSLDRLAEALREGIRSPSPHDP